VRDPSAGARSEVASIWKELLGVAALDDADDFFALGGDSLLAAQLRTRLELQSGRPVSLRELLREPTLAGMIALMQARESKV
jgi:aryl carrier-like protein